MPKFNLEGNEKIGSLFGCMFTVITVSLLLVYGSIQGFLFMSGSRPNISSYTVVGARRLTESVDLRKH